MDRDLLLRALRPLLPDLLRFCRWLVGADGSADDLAQDVVLRALQQGDAIDDPSRLKSWLFRTARNAFIDGQRARASRERLVALDGGEFDVGEVPVSLPPLDDRLDLEREIQRMPEFARSALLLADLWGLTYEEIAAVLDVPLNTVRSRVARARARLASALAATAVTDRRHRAGDSEEA